MKPRLKLIRTPNGFCITSHTNKSSQILLPTGSILSLVLVCASLLVGCTGQAYQGSETKAFSTWEDQFALARAEATKIDRTAVLEAVITNPIDCSAHTAESVNEDFWFSRSWDPSIRVTIQDTDPPSVVDLDPGSFPTDVVPQQTASDYEAPTGDIKISPREACEATVLEAAKRLGQTEPKASVVMFPDRDTESQFGVSSVWEVSYRVLDKGRVMSVTFDVSAQTGEILMRYPLEGDVTPASTP